MTWYMIIIYSILVIGAVSSFLNYGIQRDWKHRTFKLGKYADKRKHSSDYQYKPEPKDI